jgi:coproporphyrinogen III oxidase-like Fe-S oxidoreductase
VAGWVVRTEKPRSPRAYLEAGGRAGSRHEVDAAELPFEFMLNALRLRTGFTLAEFEGATGQRAKVIRPTLAALEARGLLTADGACLQPTELGFRFLNDLMGEFLPATPAERPALRARGPVPAAG